MKKANPKGNSAHVHPVNIWYSYYNIIQTTKLIFWDLERLTVITICNKNLEPAKKNKLACTMEESVYLAPCFNNAGEYHMRAGTFQVP